MNKVAVVMAAALVLWAGLLSAVVGGSAWLASVDKAVMQAALAARNPAATAAFRGVTWLGSGAVYLAVAAAGLAIGRSRGWGYLALATGSLALAQLTRVAVNLAVHRPRPPQSHWLTAANFYAFPSGHTLAAGLGFGLAAWLVWQVDRRVGSGLFAVAAVLVLLVGWSRVYLGVHWASDVVASLFLAVFWLCATILLASRVLG